MAKFSLRYRAFNTVFRSRFLAKEEAQGHRLTDEEVKAEAQHLLETTQHDGIFEGEELKKAIRQMKRLLK